MIPVLHNHYTEDLARKLGHLRPDERKRLDQSLEKIDVEEQRAATLYVKGTISEHIWNNLISFVWESASANVPYPAK